MSWIHIKDNKYRIYVELGKKPDGSRNRKTKTVTLPEGLSKKQITMEMNRREYEYQEEILKKNSNLNNIADSYFPAVADWWLETKQIEESSKATYEKHFRNKTNEYFNNIKLKDITSVHMTEFFSFLKKQTKNGARKKDPITGEFYYEKTNIPLSQKNHKRL